MNPPDDENDPLWKLLGQARPIQPKGNFVPNVMRVIRSQPQERGLWAVISHWWTMGEPRWATPALTTAVALAFIASQQLGPSAPQISQADTTPVPATSAALGILAESTVTPLDTLDEVDALLAMEDTSSLSDREISFLLY
jgi:hypothetical protein